MKNSKTIRLFAVGVTIFFFSCADVTPYERASANSGLNIAEPMKIDSLKQVDLLNGNYEFTAVFSYPDSLSKRVAIDGQEKGFVKRSTIKDSVPLFMERYVVSGDDILFSHKREKNLNGDQYVIINLSQKKIIMYFFQH